MGKFEDVKESLNTKEAAASILFQLWKYRGISTLSIKMSGRKIHTKLKHVVDLRVESF